MSFMLFSQIFENEIRLSLPLALRTGVFRIFILPARSRTGHCGIRIVCTLSDTWTLTKDVGTSTHTDTRERKDDRDSCPSSSSAHTLLTPF